MKVLAKLLPRHMQLIERINETWLATIKPQVAAEVASNPAPAPAEEEEEEADAAAKKAEPVDPVKEALKEYSIIQENPWNKGEM